MTTVDENITELPLGEEIEKSFLNYSIAVVTSRAIPSVLDGMKPVHRRAVWSAFESGYRSDKPTVKSARIVGDCFVAGTLVSTPTGLTPVEDLHVGDLVTDAWGSAHSVAQTYVKPHSDLVELSFRDGHTLRTTPGQRFQAVQADGTLEWVEAKDLAGATVIGEGTRAADLHPVAQQDSDNARRAYLWGILSATGAHATETAVNDEVPTLVLEDAASWPSYLAGFLDRGGHIEQTRRARTIVLSTASPTIATQVSNMLSRLGIPSTLATREDANAPRILHTVNITGSHAVRLTGLIKPFVQLLHKRNALTELTNHEPLDLVDQVDDPAPEHLQGLTLREVLTVTPSSPADTYDIQVDSEEHAFVAAGLSVHNCMGNYHPHGDSAVYDTIAQLVRPWVQNVPLFHGAGNWGSIGGEDPAAASRYCVIGTTRVRMADGSSPTIAQLAETHGLTAEGEVAADLTVTGLDGTPVKADKIFHSGRHETRTLRTESGLELTGSFNHPVLTLRPDSTLEQPVFTWKTLESIQPGDIVTTLRKEIPAASPVTPDEVDRLRALARTNLDRIPEWVWTARATVKARALQELFAPEGILGRVEFAINPGRLRTGERFDITVALPITSPQLACDIQQLLLELGVVATTDSTHPGSGLLVVGREEVTRFSQRIGLRGVMQEELEAALKSLPGGLRLPGAYGYSKVASIEDSGDADVYSIRVNTDDHAFITNGIISHNTEARLTKAAELLCRDINEDTIDWIDNYDATKKEPVALPSAFPHLLVNGTSGIAVGMACNFAPHNLREVVAALAHLLEHPNATVDDLMRHLPGPDFPTGGVVVDDGGVAEAYRTGRGKFRLRARTSIEDVTARKRGIVITELPYAIGPEKVMSEIAKKRSEDRLDGISNVTNFTDRKSGLRLVVEVKNGFDPERILAQLFRETSLEVTFGINQLALIGTEPRQMGLIELCEHYLGHRVSVVTRRSKFRLRKAKARAHIVEGLITAHSRIDEAVQLIKKSKTPKTASEKLQKTFKLTEEQAIAILEMTLRRLTGLEIGALKDELATLKQTIKDLEALIGSDEKLRATVATELKEVGEILGEDRRSTIVAPTEVTTLDDVDLEDAQVAEAPAVLAWDVDGNIFRREADTIDRPLHLEFTTTTTADVGVVTDQGTLLSLSMLGVSTTPTPLEQHVTLPEGEHVVGLVPRRDDEGTLVLATSHGFVKKIMVSQFAKKDGLPVITFKNPDDKIIWVGYTRDGTGELALISTAARMLKLDLETVRPQGRTGGGVAGMKLADDATILTAGLAGTLVTVTDQGSAKATPLNLYPVKGRGGAGVRCHNFKSGEAALAVAAVVPGEPVVASKRAVKPVKIVEKRDASGVKPGISGELSVGYSAQ